MNTLTADFNEALLNLSALISRYFPLGRSSPVSREFRAVTKELRHHGLALQTGVVVGDPRDLLKLALDACADRGVCGLDIMDIVNAHQRGNPSPVAMPKAVGDGT